MLGPLVVTLFATFEPESDEKLKVCFESIEFRLFGAKIINSEFPEGTTRIWCLTYVDEDTRVVRAGAAGGLVNGVKSNMAEDEYYFFMSKIADGKEDEGASNVVNKVEVGSKEYYKGFLDQSLGEDITERDPMGGLDQALKLGGGATVLLGVLFLLFMQSNGLI